MRNTARDAQSCWYLDWFQQIVFCQSDNFQAGDWWFPESPCYQVYSKILWFFVSKAFLRSMKQAFLYFFLSHVSLINSVKTFNAWEQEWFARKPHWKGSNSLCFLINSIKRDWMNFSNSLLVAGTLNISNQTWFLVCPWFLALPDVARRLSWQKGLVFVFRFWLVPNCASVYCNTEVQKNFLKTRQSFFFNSTFQKTSLLFWQLSTMHFKPLEHKNSYFELFQWFNSYSH